MNNKKSWRRITIGGVAWLSVCFSFVYCVEKGLAVSWFNAFVLATVPLALIIGGYIEATDLLDRWKLKK